MNKKNHFFYLTAVLAAMFFFSFVLGGCGGGGSGSLSAPGTDEGGSEPGIPTAPETSVWDKDTVISLLGATEGFDFDSDGKMDFLDFDGVPQYHLGDHSLAAAGELLDESSSFEEASEAKLSVPVMVWLEKLHPQNENPNIFQVYLEKGKEYTFEFSKNLTEALTSVYPDLQIFDPENAALPFIEAFPLRPEITPIPAESPSVICYTIKAEVSGYYLVVVRSPQSGAESYAEESDLLSDDEKLLTDFDTSSVIFVYEEFRNEQGEAGYFTRFKYADITGEKTDTIGIRDIIQLRKLFLEAASSYFGKDGLYGPGLADDKDGSYSGSLDFVFDGLLTELYLNYLNKVQYALGLVDESELLSEEDAETAALARLADPKFLQLLDAAVGDDVDDTDVETLKSRAETSADQALREYYYHLEDNDAKVATASYKSSKPAYSARKVLVPERRSGGGASLAAKKKSSKKDEQQRSVIDANISGVPYEKIFLPGTTYSGVTFASPKGGITASGFEEMLKKKAEEDPSPVSTKFWMEWVSTREEAEKHSEVTGGGKIALAKQASGSVNVSAGNTKNYKYGLTSMTLVLHYEIVEDEYRLLSNRGYVDLAFDNDLHIMARKLLPDEFREQYGDYFVAGYQYGACYEASIAITTDTMEKLNEVKTGLQLNLSFDSVSASADIASKMQETFKKANAQIDINVVQTGFGFNADTIPVTNSGDIDSVTDVFTKYDEFRAKLAKSASELRNQFVPIRVHLMKWRSLSAISDQVLKRYKNKPGGDGTIPLTWKQKADAEALQSAIANMRAYYNDSESARKTIPAETNLEIVTSFNKLVGKVSGAGEDFYTTGDTSGDRLSEELPKIVEISMKCKDLSDRYVFYNKLVQAQTTEAQVTKKLQDELKAWDTDDDGDSDRLKIVQRCPFGQDTGGESGFMSFPMSNTVTNDFYACEENPKKIFDTKINIPWGCHVRTLDVPDRHGMQSRLEWFEGQRTNTTLANDWQPDVGDAYIEATAKEEKDADGKPVKVNAVFAYVKVKSLGTAGYYDRRRFTVGNSLAVGRPSVGFRFMSSYGRTAHWTIQGIAVRLREKDYPFSGLK